MKCSECYGDMKDMESDTINGEYWQCEDCEHISYIDYDEIG